MNKLKLCGMARAFQAILESKMGDNFTLDELLAHLIDAELDDKHNRRLKRLIKQAKFRYQASLEEIDFGLDRNLDKNMILRFSGGLFVEKKEDIVITGPTGVGKSYLATALGFKGCLYGYKVSYFNCHKLFSSLKLAQAEGIYDREIRRIAKQDLLILDDFGLHPLDSQSRLMLLEIIEDRHRIKSTVIASQFPINSWHEIIGEPTIADAFLL